ncbi:MAG TPA: tRNA guanosine(34) transglycosylase Tgt [Ktedonobacterales bacterium]
MTAESTDRHSGAGADLDRAPTELRLPHGTLALPAFLPDATLGVVRSVDAEDLLAVETPAVVMNAYHLMRRPGSSTVQALGGLHRMSGWRLPIITDSGGFQAYSLIQRNPKLGSIGPNGITIRAEESDRKYLLTPEKAMQLQLSYDTDVAICLDECTHVDAPEEEQRAAVERTIQWARRCRAEFDRLVAQKRLAPERRPLLFGVIQGGGYPDLRRRCAEALLEIGFDGYGFGGWPLDSNGKLLTDIIAFTRAQVPARYPMHALGVGQPANIVACADAGYAIFDSAMPTRDARHGRLFVFTSERPALTTTGSDWFQYLYVEDEKHIKASGPISPYCDCPTCARYSLGYLRHLYKVGDSLYHRLATLHNLRFMVRLTTLLHERQHAA